MSTSTIMTLNYDTGIALIFMTPVFLMFLTIVLYIVWPLKKDKDDILDIN